MDDAPDLELLRLFEFLYRERHLTRAAARAGRSQPAMSRALARMRELFKDPLFVRTPRAMVPTARADTLAPEVARVLAQARALVRPERFDVSALDRTFSIATSDMVEQQLVAGVVHRMREVAPKVDLSFRPVGNDLDDLLSSGQLDLAFAPQTNLPAGVVSQHLFDDTFLCAVRTGHPVVKKRLTLEHFVSLAHIQIAPRGLPGGPVDRALGARGLSRRVAVRTPSFLTAPILVASSDLILTAPTRVLLPLAAPFAFRTFPPPLPLEGFRIHQMWHPRSHDDPAHRFFRNLVADVARASQRVSSKR